MPTTHLSPARQNLPSAMRLKELLRTDLAGAQGVRRALDLARRQKITSTNVRAALEDCAMWLDAPGLSLARSADDTQHTFLGLEYVNVGDPYRPTVIFDWKEGRFLFGGWGDIVERDERRFRDGV